MAYEMTPYDGGDAVNEMDFMAAQGLNHNGHAEQNEIALEMAAVGLNHSGCKGQSGRVKLTSVAKEDLEKTFSVSIKNLQRSRGSLKIFYPSQSNTVKVGTNYPVRNGFARTDTKIESVAGVSEHFEITEGGQGTYIEDMIGYCHKNPTILTFLTCRGDSSDIRNGSLRYRYVTPFGEAKWKTVTFDTHIDDSTLNDKFIRIDLRKYRIVASSELDMEVSFAANTTTNMTVICAASKVHGLGLGQLLDGNLAAAKFDTIQ
jgi:hypothetical protein